MIILKLVCYRYHQSGQNHSNFSQCELVVAANITTTQTVESETNSCIICTYLFQSGGRKNNNFIKAQTHDLSYQTLSLNQMSYLEW